MGSETAADVVRAYVKSAIAGGDWIRALDLAQQLVGKEPAHGETYFLLGRALEFSAQEADAVAAYEKAVKLGVDEETEYKAKLYSERISDRQRAREREEAERAIGGQAVEALARLGSFGAAVDAGRRAVEAQDEELAYLAYQRAVELAVRADERRVARTGLGAAARRRGDVDEGLRLLAEAVELDPRPAANAPAFTALVAAHRAAGNPHLALPHIQAVLEARPDDAYMLWAATAVYTELGDLIRAADLARRAAEVAPQQRESRRVLEALRDGLAADESVEEARQIDALISSLCRPRTSTRHRPRTSTRHIISATIRETVGAADDDIPF